MQGETLQLRKVSSGGSEKTIIVAPWPQMASIPEQFIEQAGPGTIVVNGNVLTVAVANGFASYLKQAPARVQGRLAAALYRIGESEFLPVPDHVNGTALPAPAVDVLRFGRGCYDLGRNPPSFNALDFLLQLEKWRICSGLDRVQVAVLPGPRDGFRMDNLPPDGPAERCRWRDNIVMPMPRLLPSCGVPAVLGDPERDGKPEFGRGEYLIGFRTLIQMAREGLYPFRAPDDEIKTAREKYGEHYVTITIRDTGWWVQRTSQIVQWRVVADELERMGFRAVFVPDGTKADQPIDGFATDPDAARNVVKRAALYAGADMNLGIPNGPLWLCWFMGAPVMICKMINENEPSTRAANYRASGLNPGSQLANARPRQRLMWGPEDAATILREFESLMA